MLWRAEANAKGSETETVKVCASARVLAGVRVNANAAVSLRPKTLVNVYVSVSVSAHVSVRVNQRSHQRSQLCV